MNSQQANPSSDAPKVFQHTSVIPTSLEVIIRFHEKPNALNVLTPPPLIVKIVDDKRISNTEGTVDFVLWFGPIRVRWLARHEPGPIATSFIDRMLVGPLATWEHQHIFRAVEGGVQLRDRITFSHKRGWRGWVTRLLFDGLALKFLFWYRHWRTRRECRKLVQLP
jgi:ligand-binding SRPBCC domain-containing protein